MTPFGGQRTLGCTTIAPSVKSLLPGHTKEHIPLRKPNSSTRNQANPSAGIKSKWICLDCTQNTSEMREHYFVRTELWLSCVQSKQGMLCVGCLESRLGRLLTPADFTDCYINNPKFAGMSQRLLDRIGYERLSA